jgi:hypothetical protein
LQHYLKARLALSRGSSTIPFLRADTGPRARLRAWTHSHAAKCGLMRVTEHRAEPLMPALQIMDSDLQHAPEARLAHRVNSLLPATASLWE